MPRPSSLRCVYCHELVIERITTNIARADLRRLRDHLLGCPAALAACAPALPVFSQSELVKQFRREELRAG
jgi:hypothetical protein